MVVSLRQGKYPKADLPQPFEDSETLILGLIEDAENFSDEELSDFRERTWRFYNGQVDSVAKRDRSSVVKTEVRDTVELLMPSLLTVLMSSTNIVEFTTAPGFGDTEDAAKQTEEINDIYFNQNPGWLNTHDAVKDSLIARSGVFKVYEDEYTEWAEEWIDPEDELSMSLVEMAGGKVVEDDADYDDETDILDLKKVMMPQSRKKICISLVPPENLIIDRFAKHGDDATIIGERTRMRLGDLVKMGFPPDMVKDFGDAEEDEPEQEDEARTGYNRGRQHSNAQEDSGHWALRKITVKEVYPLLDPEDKGELERYQCFIVNDTVLRVKMVRHQPYVVFSSIRIPHTAIGRCPGENSIEFQEQGSAIYRQLMDNLYWSNNPGLQVLRNSANPYQVENWSFGQIIDVKVPNAVTPIEIPFIGDKAISVLEYLEKMRESRTGGYRDAMGLNPKVLRGQTATAAEGAMSQATRQIEMYARVIAETGLAPVFRKIYEVKNGKPPAMGMKINVGLGNGTTEERLIALQLIAQKQEQILLQLGADNGICGMDQYGYTLNKIAQLVPYYDASKMFNTPEQIKEALAAKAQQGGQEPPSPELEKVKGELQIKEKESAAKLQGQQAKLQIDSQGKQADSQAKGAALQQKTQAEIALMDQSSRAKLALAEEKQQADISLDQRELEAEIQLEAAKVVTQERSGQGNIPKGRRKQ